MKPRGPKVDQRIIDARERQREALALRKRSLTYDEIARQLGYNSPAGAQKAVRRAIAEIPKERADELRQLECEKLDALERAWMDLALGPRTFVNEDTGEEQIVTIHKDAAQVVLKTIDQRTKLLGLARPSKHEVTGANGGPIGLFDPTKATDEQLARILSPDFDASELEDEEDDECEPDADGDAPESGGGAGKTTPSA